MISYIRGELAAVEKEKVIVDVGGVWIRHLYAGTGYGAAASAGK